ncbi:unnamed protein product [Phaedon cochleariae]|uniref:Choline/carnitine acyltransferase domain-containing protein n=1 Tax=Phaedon cochleariae TaxID=80249 RepID=A0A9N9SMX1_PHACE|nr:unnamed protein product [Phaedon cochleariae]
MISKNQRMITNQRILQTIFKMRNIKSNKRIFDSAKIRMFGNTLNLPSLPVPTLNQTIEKYLKSVTPFLNESELINTKTILKEFSSPNGIGNNLQDLLIQKANSSENWLAEWWLKTAYLEYREPVVIFSSPGLVFPLEDFSIEDERVVYTAKLIMAALDYKFTIDNDQLPLDKMGKDPLDMNQYKKIFGTCRVPKKNVDEIEFNSESRHIIVVRNNNFFSIEVIKENMKRCSFKDILGMLHSVLNESTNLGDPVGILTTENRNNWSRAYDELIKDPLNRDSVAKIQKSLFLVALDNPMPDSNDSRRSLASKQCIHGGGSMANSANRWFDKTVQFVIGQDGIVGLTYEHSPSEGQPIASMTDYLINYIKHIDTNNNMSDTKFDGTLEKLEFKVSDTLKSYIIEANENIDRLVKNLDMDCFQFTSFGKEFVKTQKLSPDSFIQIAMQYAFYRIHMTPGAHYESAATRKYIHGRTETIRSCSIESIAFAKAMLDSKKTIADKVVALKEAIESHKKYAMEAVNGFGVDRHLLGLKLIAQENGIELPRIFTDPSFKRSSHMRISTSQVATRCDGFMCYAPLTADGYGCCYNPRPFDINFGVSAFVAHADTSATKFRLALEESLGDMHDILAKSQKAKL